MRRLMRPTKIALALTLALLLAKAILPMTADDFVVSPSSVEARSEAVREHVAGSDDGSRISEILMRNPFGGGMLVSPAHPAVDAASVTSSTNLLVNRRLIGTIAGPPRLARAMIQDISTGETASCSIGDRIGNAVLTEIHPDRAVLINDETQEVMELTMGNDSSGKIRQPAAGLVTAAGAAMPATAGNSPMQWSPESILSRATIVPRVTSGKVDGLEITDLADVPFAAFIGLREGDIIRGVNGQAITSTPQAFQIMKKARSLPRLSLDLERQGRKHNLTFDLE